MTQIFGATALATTDQHQMHCQHTLLRLFPCIYEAQDYDCIQNCMIFLM